MAENEKEKSLKGKSTFSLENMKKGAKVLPSVIAKKGKEWIKGQVEAAKERAKIEKELEKEVKAAELAAYKAEAIKQAKIRGKAKAKKGTTGARGALAELGEIGDSLSVGGILGIGDAKETSKKGKLSVSNYLFSGLGKKKKEEGDEVG